MAELLADANTVCAGTVRSDVLPNYPGKRDDACASGRVRAFLWTGRSPEDYVDILFPAEWARNPRDPVRVIHHGVPRAGDKKAVCRVVRGAFHARMRRA